MNQQAKTVLKAACIQAAATLLAAQPQAFPPGGGSDLAPDTAACARFARDLFEKVTDA